VPVPWRLVRTPRVSRHLAAAPQKKTLSTHGYVHLFSFRPPSTTLFRSGSTMESRLLRANKELSHQQGRACVHVSDESMRAKSRGGYLCGKVRDKLRVSIYTRHVSFPHHTQQTQTPFSHYMRHLNQGRVEGGKCNKVYVTIVHLPKSTPPCGLRAMAVTGRCPGPR
jgi:hypothetical protein